MEPTETNDPVNPPNAPRVTLGAPNHRATGRWDTILKAVITLLLLVGLVMLILHGIKGNDQHGKEAGLVKDDQYQTVFLTNGQVYFGKLQEVNSEYYQLTDIFYLQVQQSVQPSGGSSSSTPTTTAAPNNNNGQTQLVKLGDELHAPEDSMQINRSQVQFWENIKADGKVAQAIASYKNK